MFLRVQRLQLILSQDCITEPKLKKNGKFSGKNNELYDVTFLRTFQGQKVGKIAFSLGAQEPHEKTTKPKRHRPPKPVGYVENNSWLDPVVHPYCN